MNHLTKRRPVLGRAPVSGRREPADAMDQPAHAGRSSKICRLDALSVQRYDRPRSGWGVHPGRSGQDAQPSLPAEKRTLRGPRPLASRGRWPGIFYLPIYPHDPPAPRRRRPRPGAGQGEPVPGSAAAPGRRLPRAGDADGGRQPVRHAASSATTRRGRFGSAATGPTCRPGRTIWSAAPPNCCGDAPAANSGRDIRLWKRIPMAAGLARRLQRCGRRPGRAESPVAAGTEPGRTRRPGRRAGQRRGVLLRRRRPPGVRAAAKRSNPSPWAGRSISCWSLRRSACPRRRCFANVTLPAEPLTGAECRRAAEAGDVEELGRRLHNRLQPAAERLCPAGGRSGGNGWPPWGRPGQLDERQRQHGVRPVPRRRTRPCASHAVWAPLREEGGGPRVHIVRSCD